MFDREDSEQRQAVENMFPWLDIGDFIADACNEANYWMGYKALFIRVISDDVDLAEGLDLVKKASSLKTSLYKYVGERQKLIDDRLDEIRQNQGVYSDVKQQTHDKELKRLEDAIVVKAFEVFRQRVPFMEYLEAIDLPVRTRKRPRKKKED